jgi:transposase
METKFVHFAGIDVSKAKIDVCVMLNGEKSVLYQGNFEQSKKGFNELRKWLQKLTGKQKHAILICIENTGLYDDALLYFLAEQGYAVCLENATLIKKSIRDTRAKNDQLDARHIAIYALRHYDELEIWEKPREVVDKIKQLLSHRSNLVESLKRIKQAIKELENFKWAKVQKTKSYDAGVKGLEKDIKQIEDDIWKLIKNDKALLMMFTLLVSIPAIGKITACHFICYTNEFKRVKSGKHLSSYCGVVPFEQESGTIKKPGRLSKHANKKLKRLLHLCAVTAIKMKGEFAVYYQRKIAEGKHVLKVLNGIRNKLALRIAAVIKKQEPYNENYIYQH